MAVDRFGNESIIVTSTPPVLMITPHKLINDGLIDPRITFIRASIATRTNSVGLIETVPVNTPRLDHDPVTLAQKGLYIEEARTNVILNSSSIGETSWQIFNSTITANAAVSPSGSLTATKIVANTTNVDHIARHPLTLGSTITYT